MYRLGQLLALSTSPNHVTVADPPQAAVAVTADGLGAGTAEGQLTVIGAGHVMPGAAVLFTVIACVHVWALPQVSVAL